jgi:hypothetical protein
MQFTTWSNGVATFSILLSNSCVVNGEEEEKNSNASTMDNTKLHCGNHVTWKLHGKKASVKECCR